MIKKFDKKICLLALAALAVAGFLIWLAFCWQLEKIRNISDDIQKKQLDSQVQQERRQGILALGKELGDVEKNQREMGVMLADKEDAVPFLEALEALATETGNSIKISVFDLSKMKSPTVKKPAAAESDAESTKDIQKEAQAQKKADPKSAKQDFSDQMGFSVELTGEYRSLVDFLTKLENVPYFVRVYNFQIKKSTPQSQTQAGQSPPPNAENKNIQTILTIGVYTNGAK